MDHENMQYTYDLDGKTHTESYSSLGPYDHSDVLADLAGKLKVIPLIPAQPRGGKRNDLDELTENALVDIGVTNIKPV